jgi:hypothetical protein
VIQNFTVSYDVGDGSGIPPVNQTVASGGTFYLPDQGNMTAPSNYTFKGWRTNGQNYAPGNSFTVTSNTIFLAQWLTSTDTGPFTVSYNAGAGSGTPPSSQTVASGGTIYLPSKGSMTAPSGQTFNGWRANNHDYTAGDSFTVTDHTIFSAQWTTDTGLSESTLRYETEAITNQDEQIVSLGSDGTNNSYTLQLGTVKRVPVSATAARLYDGVSTLHLTNSKSIVTSATVEQSVEKCVSNSFTVTDGSTDHQQDAAWSVGI